MRLAYALTTIDMRMREAAVTLGIPKSSYTAKTFWWMIIGTAHEISSTYHIHACANASKTPFLAYPAEQKVKYEILPRGCKTFFRGKLNWAHIFNCS